MSEFKPAFGPGDCGCMCEEDQIECLYSKVLACAHCPGTTGVVVFERTFDCCPDSSDYLLVDNSSFEKNTPLLKIGSSETRLADKNLVYAASTGWVVTTLKSAPTTIGFFDTKTEKFGENITGGRIVAILAETEELVYCDNYNRIYKVKIGDNAKTNSVVIKDSASMDCSTLCGLSFAIVRITTRAWLNRDSGTYVEGFIFYYDVKNERIHDYGEHRSYVAGSSYAGWIWTVPRNNNVELEIGRVLQGTRQCLSINGQLVDARPSWLPGAKCETPMGDIVRDSETGRHYYRIPLPCMPGMFATSWYTLANTLSAFCWVDIDTEEIVFSTNTHPVVQGDRAVLLVAPGYADGDEIFDLWDFRALEFLGVDDGGYWSYADGVQMFGHWNQGNVITCTDLIFHGGVLYQLVFRGFHILTMDGRRTNAYLDVIKYYLVKNTNAYRPHFFTWNSERDTYSALSRATTREDMDMSRRDLYYLLKSQYYEEAKRALNVPNGVSLTTGLPPIPQPPANKIGDYVSYPNVDTECRAYNSPAVDEAVYFEKQSLVYRGRVGHSFGAGRKWGSPMGGPKGYLNDTLRLSVSENCGATGIQLEAGKNTPKCNASSDDDKSIALNLDAVSPEFRDLLFDGGEQWA